MGHVEGRVVLVTGAGSGFGRIVSELLAARGALVVGTDIDEAGLDAAFAGIRAAGGRAASIRADVTVLDDMIAAATFAVEQFGAIDVLVNNAGVMPLAFFADHAMASSAWDKAIDVNIKGVVHGISAVYDEMIAQGRGHVVNISSIYGNAGTSGSAVYSATKAAVAVISDSLRIEAKGKIKVTTVKPTGVPGTNLATAIVNPAAFLGLLGEKSSEFTSISEQLARGTADPGYLDADDVRYFAISPDELAQQIVYVIDQPWGVSISDITVRASGDLFVI